MGHLLCEVFLEFLSPQQRSSQSDSADTVLSVHLTTVTYLPVLPQLKDWGYLAVASPRTPGSGSGMEHMLS